MNKSWFAADHPYKDASPLSNQSLTAAHLRSGHGGPGFSVLAPEIQDQVLAHVLAMSSDQQPDYQARMQQMDSEELLASVRPPRMCNTMQPSPYTVKRGDSLGKIARANYLRLPALIEASPQIENPNVISSGQVINIPVT